MVSNNHNFFSAFYLFVILTKVEREKKETFNKQNEKKQGLPCAKCNRNNNKEKI